MTVVDLMDLTALTVGVRDAQSLFRACVSRIASLRLSSGPTNVSEGTDPPFYIGIASGASVKAALSSRMDKTKFGHRITVMIALHEARSRPDALALEAALINWARHNHAAACLNERAGTPDSKRKTKDGSRFFVYLALVPGAH